MKEVDAALLRGFESAIESQSTLVGITRRPEATSYLVRNENDEEFSISMRQTPVYVVGVDIVNYSRRSIDGQLFLTGWLFHLIRQVLVGLRRIQWLAQDQPYTTISLGDGAMVVFDEDGLGPALAFCYWLNMWLEDLNLCNLGRDVHPSVEEEQPYPILPLQCRFALAKGTVFFTQGIDETDNAVGDGLVTCARILSASKGQHFLIDSVAMRDIERQGGIDRVAGHGDPWNWCQEMHAARLPDRKIKSGRFGFYNVFGKYKPRALQMALGAAAPGGATYNIGSHDVSTISG